MKEELVSGCFACVILYGTVRLTPEVVPGSLWPLEVEAVSAVEETTSFRLLPFVTAAVPLRRRLAAVALREWSFSFREVGSS